MFWKKYKYFISYWYELNNTEGRVGDGFIEVDKKLNNYDFFSEIRQIIKREIESKSGEKCNCIGLINVKKIK